MQKLIDGIHQFQSNIVHSQKEFFQRLAHGQSPETLFITCSDSRINPNLITQTGPGDLFIIRNAGNIVPPAGAPVGGEVATIEYAINVLKVREIVVCGHSHCGAIQALMDDPEKLKGLPSVAAWLKHAESTRQVMLTRYKHLSGKELVNAAIQENVLAQIDNLRTLPSVAAALAAERLRLNAWVYKIETGGVFGYDATERQFIPVNEVKMAPVERLAALRSV